MLACYNGGNKINESTIRSLTCLHVLILRVSSLPSAYFPLSFFSRIRICFPHELFPLWKPCPHQQEIWLCHTSVKTTIQRYYQRLRRMLVWVATTRNPSGVRITEKDRRIIWAQLTCQGLSQSRAIGKTPIQHPKSEPIAGKTKSRSYGDLGLLNSHWSAIIRKVTFHLREFGK